MSRKRLARLAATVLVVGLVAYLFGRSLADNWAAVRELDISVDGWAVASVLIFAAAVPLSGLLWGSMLTHLGAGPVPRLEAIRVQCLSWLLKYIPGQVGSVANKVLWGGQRGISRALVVITFVYENVFLLLGSIVPTVVVLFLADAFADASHDLVSTLLPVAVALVPLALVMDRRVFRWGVNLVSRRALKKDVPPEYFLAPRPALGYQLAFLLPRVLNGVGFVLIAVSVLDVPSSTWVPLAATYVLAGAVGIMAVLVPSGLGVREGVIVLLASRYVPVEQAIVLSLLARLYSTIGDGVVAAVYAGLSARIRQRGQS
ncbi:lysylphosphatidylglycerol synthase domain-containing protein [Cellulomonas oligotrophica]|uniref:Membrane protein n=1 Tax=Cellulomonas oligotrophica TaxID=931536 RepID=A0A7Y9FE07_9CELL|nr:lysylphosphatidylglycerol synthase domain-containing protein [Cellulomonas oligotrophica]NYD85227.1 uncharacterized membrane protein YbhN (UPF0104 family) [Cellulomonas oligotrophica]GIG33337.1 membrane protein [Cellulomonas oligotrophica]